MKILGVRANNRKKVFEVRVENGELDFPYAKLVIEPKPSDRVVEAYPDPDVGCEAFTYRLESGSEDTVHVDAVLEYNQDPSYLNDILLHRLSVEAQKAVDESGLSKRELIRRLETSRVNSIASLIHLDPTYTAKSVAQMLPCWLPGQDVDVVGRRSQKSHGRRGKQKVVV